LSRALQPIARSSSKDISAASRIAPSNATSSLALINHPFRPLSTNSSAAPIRSVPITGNPDASPSGTTSPQPSYRDGTHNTSAFAYSAGNSFQSLNPTNSTRSLTVRSVRASDSRNSP